MKHEIAEIRIAKQSESVMDNNSISQIGKEPSMVIYMRQPMEQLPESVIKDMRDTRPFYQKFGKKRKY